MKEGGTKIALSDFLTPWAGTACRHIPDGTPYDVLDFSYAGKRSDNRWNILGEPTLYLASDHSVAVGEFSRHYREDRTEDLLIRSNPRRVFDLEVKLDLVADLRNPDVCAILAEELHLDEPMKIPFCFLDLQFSRQIAQYLRRVPSLQGMVAPSMAFLDDMSRGVLVLFLEKLPRETGSFITAVTRDGLLGLGDDLKTICLRLVKQAPCGHVE